MKVILISLNSDVEDVNEVVMQRLPDDYVEYLSNDSVKSEEEMQRDLYPVEFLNTINVSEISAH